MSIEAIDQYAKKDWWLFDTNCLSELSRFHKEGRQQTIDAFVLGRSILIDLTNLVELSKAPPILHSLPTVFRAARYVCVPTQTHAYVRRDLFERLHLQGLDPNVLGLFELNQEFALKLNDHKPFLEAIKTSQRNVDERYEHKCSLILARTSMLETYMLCSNPQYG